MSAFWKRAAVVESHAKILQTLCFINWAKSSELPTVVWSWASPALNEFETKFLVDLCERWVSGQQHPSRWSQKQVGLLHKIYDKAKDYDFKQKRAQGL